MFNKHEESAPFNNSSDGIHICLHHQDEHEDTEDLISTNENGIIRTNVPSHKERGSCSYHFNYSTLLQCFVVACIFVLGVTLGNVLANSHAGLRGEQRSSSESTEVAPVFIKEDNENDLITTGAFSASTKESNSGEKKGGAGIFEFASIVENKSENDEDNRLHHDHRQLLDFAVVGFGKCGTTSLLKFFNIEHETYMGYTEEERGDGAGRERCPQSKNDLYKWGYEKYVDTPITTGFKCPNALSRKGKVQIISTFQMDNPHPKLIVSIRHPVSHFQSSYNYFYRELKWHDELPNPDLLLGHCGFVCASSSKRADANVLVDNPHNRKCLSSKTVGQHINTKVCTTQSSMFHYALSRLHLTPMADDDELELLDHHGLDTMPDFDGTVFLMETGQLPELANMESDRGIAMRDALERFIGLNPHTLRDRPFPPKREDRKKLINICDDEHAALRDELVQRGRKASRWILDYLLKSDRVIVANREHFVELVEAWGVDPCINARYIL